MKRFLIGLAALAIVVLGGSAAFQYYVDNHVLDRDGMENPFPEDGSDEVQLLDGNGTYVDHGALLEEIAGTWTSADGRWQLMLDTDSCMTLRMDGETALEQTLLFTYLQPGPVESTEFDMDVRTLTRGDGTALGELTSLYHKAGDGGGTLRMELTGADGGGETVELKKTGT